MAQVSTHVAVDHQTYSALAQHTQITRTAVLKCDEPSRVGRWSVSKIFMGDQDLPKQSESDPLFLEHPWLYLVCQTRIIRE